MNRRRWCSVEDYRTELLGLVAPGTAHTVPLEQAHGRVLADFVNARTGVPSFDVSAMDGYAVRWADVAGAGSDAVPLRVVADLPAGSSADPILKSGSCARVMTGTIVPTAADTVIPVECTDGGTRTVSIRQLPARGRGAHIRGQNEDVAPGDTVGTPGDRLTPGLVSTLAATGRATVPVYPRPRVAVSSTGSELRDPGARLERGQIHDSNSHFVALALSDLGAEVDRRPAIPDDPALLRATLDELTAGHDLVVLTGGAGAGAHDVPGQVLADAQRGAFVRVRMQPGKPQGWGVWNGVPVLLLPGNPVAAAVSTVVFLEPVVRRMMGAPAPRPWTARAGETLHGTVDRVGLVPARLEPAADGSLSALRSHPGQGSHLVSSLAQADVLAVVPLGVTQIPAGDAVSIIPIRGRL